MAKGTKTGGGSRKGKPNKRTQALKDAAATAMAAVTDGGLMPLELLLSIMRDESHPLDMRMDAATRAAPYVHAKLAPVNPDGEGDAASIVDAFKRILEERTHAR